MTTPVATLLPLTSLPHFQAAVKFILWLKRTNQTGWHLLPLSDPIVTPYRNQGIGLSPHFYDPHIPEDFRTWVLSREDFLLQYRSWLLDYAHYQALERELGTPEWWRWPTELAERRPASLASSRLRLDAQIQTYIDQQYFLYNELVHLRRHAAEHEITLIGDLPFYIARDSSLVWAHQNLFQLGERGAMRLQSGVPAAPDEPFAEQYWGHPLYNWENNTLEAIMNLFYQRLEFLRSFCDLVRIDHANGFFRYGAMSPEHHGWNRKLAGPDKPAATLLLQYIQSFGLGVYFEDIASDKMRLEQFMKEFDIAGTSVVTLAYNTDAVQPIPATKIKAEVLDLSRYTGNKIVFTSTHDTAPLLAWVQALPADVKTKLLQVNKFDTNLSDKKLAGYIRDRILGNSARLIVVPWQDWWLDVHRFNTPGQEAKTDWNYTIDIERFLRRI